jgi:hypothetical protein
MNMKANGIFKLSKIASEKYVQLPNFHSCSFLEFPDTRGGQYEDGRLLGCSAV